MSLNNMGCFYRRCKKLHAALRCLEQALEIELRYANDSRSPLPIYCISFDTGAHLSLADAPISPAGTHLNICAVLSELKHHEAALVHANAAISLLVPLYGDASGVHDPYIFSDTGLSSIAASKRMASANDSFIYVYVCVCVCMYACVFMCMCVLVCVCVGVHLIYLYLRVYIHMQIHIYRKGATTTPSLQPPRATGSSVRAPACSQPPITTPPLSSSHSRIWLRQPLPFRGPPPARRTCGAARVQSSW